MFDEAWGYIERCWRLLADVLAPGGGGADRLVLEPSVFAHALSVPGAEDEAGATSELRRLLLIGRHTDVRGVARHELQLSLIG